MLGRIVVVVNNKIPEGTVIVFDIVVIEEVIDLKALRRVLDVDCTPREVFGHGVRFLTQTIQVQDDVNFNSHFDSTVYE